MKCKFGFEDFVFGGLELFAEPGFDKVSMFGKFAVVSYDLVVFEGACLKGVLVFVIGKGDGLCLLGESLEVLPLFTLECKRYVGGYGCGCRLGWWVLMLRGWCCLGCWSFGLSLESFEQGGHFVLQAVDFLFDIFYFVVQFACFA